MFVYMNFIQINLDILYRVSSSLSLERLIVNLGNFEAVKSVSVVAIKLSRIFAWKFLFHEPFAA
jgi:hypothetical protein